ncbi:hypothetical protein DL93DRAFT_2227335 [Clavulina sp. PMI_390]|nr:hypothetical protein DL93DRAFT_2227335 [Clavulina sp. PMI_390]
MPPTATHAPDITTYLPTELLFAIVDALVEPTSSGAEHLLHLSTVNRVFNGVVNHKLWRSFYIGAHKSYDGASWWYPLQIRDAVEDRCLAIVRDPTRATLIVELSIHLSPHVANLASTIRRALAALPNLRVFRLLLVYHGPFRASIMHSFTDMLGSEQFPFCLDTFFCEPAVFLGSPPNFVRFIQSQSSIRNLIIGRAQAADDLKALLVPPESESQNMLPNLRYLCSPTQYIRSILHALPQTPLENAHIISQSYEDDLSYANPGMKSNAEGTIATIPATASARVSSLLVTTKATDPASYFYDLPLLLPGAYGICPSSIRTMRIGSEHAEPLYWDKKLLDWVAKETDFLSILTSLESLELFGRDSSKGRKGFLQGSIQLGPSGPLLGTSDVLELLEYCEADCPTLTHLMIKDYNQKVLTQIVDPTRHGEKIQQQPRCCQVTLSVSERMPS